MRLLFFILAINLSLPAQNSLTGDYLGQPLPGKTPEIFAPGFISTGLNEFNAVFSPEGNEFYFSVRSGWELFVIYVIKRNNEVWSEPQLASFSGKYLDADPFISADGQKLYFCSNRPKKSGGEPADWNIWMCSREGNEWSSPVILPFCTDKNEFYPTLALNGNIYFHADYEGRTPFDLNRTDIYVSKFSDGIYSVPGKLSEKVNSEFAEWDPFISPDEDYIIFTSPKPGGFGSGDLYISFRNSEGDWSKAVNMGSEINSPGQDYCPALSPDGKYFFFSSYKFLMDNSDPSSLEYRNLYENLLSFRNGSGNIYWSSSQIIKDFRPLN
jgi:Tol biopolymer transport system component